MNTRQELEELLPFYVNGTLEGEERNELEKALAGNTTLRDEFDYLTGLHREMQAMPLEKGPGEFGLKRLQKAIAEEELRADPVVRAHSKLSREQNNNRWKFVAIAACLLLVLQTAVTVHQFSGGAHRDLIAAGGKPGALKKEQTAFQVTFAPQASEAAIREMLIILNVQIVSGPSALGVYYLTAGDDPEATFVALQRSTLVESVQEAGK